MSLLTWASLTTLLVSASAYPSIFSKRASTPTVSGTPNVLGVASDPTWNRDSCTSTRVGNRELWTCRDSQSNSAFLSSTASWTDFKLLGTPKVQNGVLTMYGNNPTSNAYFPVQADECDPPAGNCNNGTRYAIWPDTRPLPVSSLGGKMSLYTWIRKQDIANSLASLVPNPATTLYRAVFDPNAAHNTLPPATVVNEEFWAENTTSYGDYGFVVHKGTAYLFGQLNNGIALAKVSPNSIEDKSAYTYFDGSKYTSTPAPLNSTTAAIPNAGTGGQGTYYYSRYFSSFVWIGAPKVAFCAAPFQISTAPAPEGPWTQPKTFYTAEAGNANCGAYSLQAHPGLSKLRGNGNDIYLTYTKVDKTGGYTTPLIHVVWE